MTVLIDNAASSPIIIGIYILKNKRLLYDINDKLIILSFTHYYVRK